MVGIIFMVVITFMGDTTVTRMSGISYGYTIDPRKGDVISILLYRLCALKMTTYRIPGIRNYSETFGTDLDLTYR